MRNSPARCKSSIVSSGRRRNSSVWEARSRSTGTSASARSSNSSKSGALQEFLDLASAIDPPLYPATIPERRSDSTILRAPAQFVCAAALIIELRRSVALGGRRANGDGNDLHG